MIKMRDFKTAFFFLKLPIAVSLIGHGLVRLPKLVTFSNWMVTSMENSILPKVLITPFSYVLPFMEAIIGLALFFGFQIKYTLFAGLVLMSILILGSCSIENWNAIEAQLVHAIYLLGLYWLWDKNQ